MSKIATFSTTGEMWEVGEVIDFKDKEKYEVIEIVSVRYMKSYDSLKQTVKARLIEGGEDL